LLSVTTKGAGGGLIGARSAAKSQVDAIGKQGRESAELFCDDQRGMVGEHDAAGANANRFCSSGDVTDDYRCGGAGDSRHVVMLGEPITVEAPGFGVLRQVKRVAQRVGGGCALRDGRQVKDGKRNHGN